MRKIEEAMCAAIKAQKGWRSGNTMVTNVSGISHVYLFGNLIAIVTEKMHGKFTFAGRNTQTTRSRLRALGVDLSTQGHEDTAWYDF